MGDAPQPSGPVASCGTKSAPKDGRSERPSCPVAVYVDLTCLREKRHKTANPPSTVQHVPRAHRGMPKDAWVSSSWAETRECRCDCDYCIESGPRKWSPAWAAVPRI